MPYIGTSGATVACAGDEALRVDFDRRVMRELHGCKVTTDAGLLGYRELHGVRGVTAMTREVLADTRTGKSGRHDLIGMLRQSVLGRLAGEDMNDANRLRRDPAMRWIVGGRFMQAYAAFASQMGRFETEWLASSENLASLAEVNGWLGPWPDSGVAEGRRRTEAPRGGMLWSCWDGH